MTKALIGRAACAPPARFALPAAIGLTLIAATLPATLAALPRTDRPVAVLAPFSETAGIMNGVARAGGSFLALAGPKIVLAMPDGPGFGARLRAQGYWFVLDARAVAACAGVFSETRI